MPTGKEAVAYWERLVKLEIKMESVMRYQKWQTGLLAALILMAVKALIFK